MSIILQPLLLHAKPSNHYGVSSPQLAAKRSTNNAGGGQFASESKGLATVDTPQLAAEYFIDLVTPAGYFEKRRTFAAVRWLRRRESHPARAQISKL